MKEWVDVSKMEKVLNNLVSNALKYTSEGGLVSLSLNVEHTTWEVTVEDNGKVISRKAQKELFKRYYRGENVINAKIPGTGISLLLVNNYVKLHKGVLTFKSTKHQGSKFTISFKRGRDHYGLSATFVNDSIKSKPNSKQNIEGQLKKINQKNELNTVKLLVVEDNNELREYLEHALANEFCVHTASNGKNALEIIRAHNLDIVASEIGMPEMDGVELTNYLKNEFETSHLPIILPTAHGEKDDIIKGLQTGVDDYITKPFGTSILLARIENIILNRQKIIERFGYYSYNTRIKNSFPSQKDQEFIEKAIALIEKHLSEVSISKDFFAKEILDSPSLPYKKLNTY